MRTIKALALAAIALAAAAAQAQPVSSRQSFRIGSGTAALCTAQSQLQDPAFGDMFDRGYAIVCRDAAAPVGQLYALRLRGGDPDARLAALRAVQARCEPGPAATVEELGPVETLECRLNQAAIGYRVYARRSGAARSTSPRASPAMTARSGSAFEASSPTARSTARSRSRPPAPAIRPPSRASRRGRSIAQRALAEAYRRNNAGDYAEASEFFAALGQREGDAAAGPSLWSTRRCKNPISAAMSRRTLCSPEPRRWPAPIR